MSYFPWILTFSFDSGRWLGLYILLFQGPKQRFLGHNPTNTTTFLAFTFFFSYLFIWLCQVLVVARGIFVVACGI